MVPTDTLCEPDTGLWRIGTWFETLSRLASNGINSYGKKRKIKIRIGFQYVIVNARRVSEDEIVGHE